MTLAPLPKNCSPTTLSSAPGSPMPAKPLLRAVIVLPCASGKLNICSRESLMIERPLPWFRSAKTLAPRTSRNVLPLATRPSPPLSTAWMSPNATTVEAANASIPLLALAVNDRFSISR